MFPTQLNDGGTTERRTSNLYAGRFWNTQRPTPGLFSGQGFGPSYPWGLVFLSGPHMNIGVDCGRFVSLEEAFRESIARDEPNPEGY